LNEVERDPDGVFLERCHRSAPSQVRVTGRPGRRMEVEFLGILIVESDESFYPSQVQVRVKNLRGVVEHRPHDLGVRQLRCDRRLSSIWAKKASTSKSDDPRLRRSRHPS